MWITDWTARAACKGTDPDELFVQGAAQNRAKLICRGATRDEALRTLRRALIGTDVVGVASNLDLLGRINYKIISGNRVYVEVGGIVYKTLYGGYWRSVFTGLEHYLLRCEQVSDSVWADESETSPVVDLPIAYSNEGWTASGHSLSFMLSRD
jgi:hypothetical protein